MNRLEVRITGKPGVGKTFLAAMISELLRKAGISVEVEDREGDFIQKLTHMDSGRGLPAELVGDLLHGKDPAVVRITEGTT